MLKDFLRDTLQGMLEAEMDQKWDIVNMIAKTKQQITAGMITAKKVTSSIGSIEPGIPRDRKGKFEPQIV